MPTSKFQLGLPFDAAFPRSSPSTGPGSSPSTDPPPVSRTKLLCDAIGAELPGAKVFITDNRTVLLSQSQKNGVRTVRAHQMFLDAPPDVRAAVAHFLAKGDGKSGRVVDMFVDAQSHLLELAARPLPPGAHKGRAHDLMPMFIEINARYFSNDVDAEIGWSQPGKPSRKRRRSITFGSYDARAKRIVIHPVLDRREVPRIAVERVVHHEMLHAVHGDMRDRGGRRIVHSRAFRADEAKFHGAKEADLWFDRNLDALLRWRPESPGSSPSRGSR